MASLLDRFIPAQEIIEASFLLIVVFLVLTNARGFSSVLNSFSAAYTGGVKALQGR